MEIHAKEQNKTEMPLILYTRPLVANSWLATSQLASHDIGVKLVPEPAKVPGSEMTC